MPLWVAAMVGALVVWGMWGVFFNLTTRYVNATSALVWEVIGAVLVGALVLGITTQQRQFEHEARGVVFGLLTGVAYTIGLLLAFVALRSANAASGSGSGKVHTVLVVTALYPLLAGVFNYLILSEPLSGRQMVGMGLGVVAIAIFMSEPL